MLSFQAFSDVDVFVGSAAVFKRHVVQVYIL